MCKSCNHGLNNNYLLSLLSVWLHPKDTIGHVDIFSIIGNVQFSACPSKTWNQNIVGLPAQPYMKNVLVFCDLPHALLPNRNIGIGVSFENKFYNSWILRIASIVNPAKTGDGNFFTLFIPQKIILKRDFCDRDGTLQEENFYWNLNFAILLMEN